MALPCVCPRDGCLAAPALLAYIAVMLLVYLPQMPSCWQSAFGTLLKLMLHLLLWPRTLQQALLFTRSVTKSRISNQCQCKHLHGCKQHAPCTWTAKRRTDFVPWIIESTCVHRLSQDIAACKQPAGQQKSQHDIAEVMHVQQEHVAYKVNLPLMETI